MAIEQISIFDMFKIGIGPSSSHTLGPWRAAQNWIVQLKKNGLFNQLDHIELKLYGSLSLTGKGHATDKAILLGLSGEDPVLIHSTEIDSKIDKINNEAKINLNAEKSIKFNPKMDISFEYSFLPFHPNGMKFQAFLKEELLCEVIYYSLGGGFICQEKDDAEFVHVENNQFPFPIENAKELEVHCRKEGMNISQIVYRNELALRSSTEITDELDKLWKVMMSSMYKGCHTKGILPGKLKVKRRAYDMHNRLLVKGKYEDQSSWCEIIRKQDIAFDKVSRWISCFALAVNEENASMGKIVTAPTNGSAGVLPSVLMYYLCFVDRFADAKEVRQFLLVAGEIGSIFKKGATISAALGGCQAEIGVSSAMAAAGLTELLGGSVEQCMVAAEIAMEHHLGMTCDPIGGLVQVPCIERNSMGAIKAIHAAHLALETNPNETLVPLDQVIATMWETAQNMNRKYKETSEGGLAVAVNLVDC